MPHSSLRFLGVVVVAAGLVACTPTPAAAPTSTSAPKPAAPTAATKPSPSPAAAAVASPSPSVEAGRLQLGSFAYNVRGTESVVGKSDLDLEVDDFYFSPTFLRGTPGQKLKLEIESEGKQTHNFSLPAQQLDKDINPGAKVDVEVTFPPSGALRFFCKYHIPDGMNGQLLAGDATPQPVSLGIERAETDAYSLQ